MVAGKFVVEEIMERDERIRPTGLQLAMVPPKSDGRIPPYPLLALPMPGLVYWRSSHSNLAIVQLETVPPLLMLMAAVGSSQSQRVGGSWMWGGKGRVDRWMM